MPRTSKSVFFPESMLRCSKQKGDAQAQYLKDSVVKELELAVRKSFNLFVIRPTIRDADGKISQPRIPVGVPFGSTVPETKNYRVFENIDDLREAARALLDKTAVRAKAGGFDLHSVASAYVERKKSIWSEATFRDYQNWYKWLAPYLDKNVLDLKHRFWYEMLRQMSFPPVSNYKTATATERETHKKLVFDSKRAEPLGVHWSSAAWGPNAARHCQAFLSGMYAQLEKDYRDDDALTVKNPMLGLSPSSKKGADVPTEKTNARRVIIPLDKMPEFIVKMESLGSRAQFRKNFYIFGLFLGFRPLLIANLSDDMIDDANRRFIIPGNTPGVLKSGYTAEQKIMVPYGPYVAQIIERQRAIRADKNPLSPYLFFREDAEDHGPGNANFSTVIKRVRESMKFEFTAYDLRRTFLSIAFVIVNGSPLEWKRLGTHRSDATVPGLELTQNYVVANPERHRRQIEFIERAWLYFGQRVPAVRDEPIEKLRDALTGFSFDSIELSAELLEVLGD